eukprot:2225697-Karenia_brevis.AAC.1
MKKKGVWPSIRRMGRRVQSVGRLHTCITIINLLLTTMSKKKRKKDRLRVKERATKNNGGINKCNSGITNGVTKTIKIKE